MEDTTGNTPETVKDESQVKRTSFTERIAKKVGMKSRDAVAEEPKAEKGKTFGTVSTITTEVNQDDDQIIQGTAASESATTNHETTIPLELGHLMAKLDQIDKKLKDSEEDREAIKKKLRYNKHEYLNNYFNLARASEEKLQQMSNKMEATDEDRDKNIKKDMQELKKRYDAVNSQLGSLETKMDTMRMDHVESSYAIQAKLDAILRNSKSQEKPVTERTQGNRVDFVEQTEQTGISTVTITSAFDEYSTGNLGGTKTFMKSGTANTTSGPGDSMTYNNVEPDAMKWAST